MTDALKQEGAGCPRCGEKTAEHQQRGQAMRWTCNACGNGGTVIPTNPNAGGASPAPGRGNVRPAPVWGRNLGKARH